MRTRKIIPRFRKSKRKFGGTKHLRNQRGGFISWLRRFLKTLFERLFGSWTPQETRDAANDLSTALESGDANNVSKTVRNINESFHLNPDQTRILNEAVDVLSASLGHETVETKAVKIAEEKKNLKKLEDELHKLNSKMSQQNRTQKVPPRLTNEMNQKKDIKTKIFNLKLKIQELENK